MATSADGGLVTIFGGSGFIGRNIVRALARDGWRMRAACRRPDLAGYLQPMGRVGQIYPVQANVRYPESVAGAIDGAGIVINAVGILQRDGSQTFQKVHVDGARAIAKAARAAGVGTLVHLSAIGADPKSASDYARSKGRGEQAVLEEFPDAIILRPSVVFGPEDDFFNRFAELAAVAPLMPLIGGGRTRFQPVFVGDVAAAVSAAVAGKARSGTVYELGGPEVLTLKQIMERVQEWCGRHRSFMPMPIPIAKLVALLSWPLPNALRPFTYDQVRLLKIDNVVSASAKSDGRTLAAFGISQPQAAGAVVPSYLERFRPRGQFSHYRG
ncbi:MAG: complex I NDUFA9 subunit family protein [Hyphomicrobiaceae bacterium]